MEDKSFWQKVIYRKGAILDPVTRLSEVVFGLIMVLTFTGSVSIATSGSDDIRTMLWSALGCNVAWGIVDGLMFLMSVILERGHNLRILKALKTTQNDAEAGEIIKNSLPPLFSHILQEGELQALRKVLQTIPDLPKRVPLTGQDFKGALAIFILVFVSTFPATIPFIILSDVPIAMRWSNGIGLLLLFITGYYIGKVSGYGPFLLGMGVSIIGALVVLLTIALGG
jgi:VIT1/CCC1 family predicted Fe2+/Mn2+ transporter